MLHAGPGAAASAEPSRRWEAISTALGEIGQDLAKALEQSGASWTGKAAGAAYDRLSVTATWATDTGADAAGMRTAVESQAEHIARARADMPTPEDVPPAQPDPTIAPAVQVVQAQTDLESTEAGAASAEERAFEVMAAYELNTNTNTGAMATFDAPRDLSHNEGVHQGELVGTQHTSPAGLGNAGGHHGGPPGGTGGASAPLLESDGRRPLLPSQGSFSGVLDPLLPGSANNNRSRDRTRNNRLAAGGSSGTGGGFSGNLGGGAGGGSGSGSGGGSGVPVGSSSPAAGSSSGATAKPVVGLGAMPTGDMQAAAASQAAVGHAAVHQSGAAAPMAPTTGAGAGGAQDRTAMRRFGMDAIGSNQWFGDDEGVVGERARRRRDFSETPQVTESVAILDEEHKLPPTVIGDSSTDR